MQIGVKPNNEEGFTCLALILKNKNNSIKTLFDK
jgi:hypothetical protein